MNLCVIGTGYVGLVSGVCFAELGNRVICVDIDKDKIKKLNNDVMPIYEKELKEMCSRNRKLGNIEFTEDIEYGVKNSEVIFIAVGTPSLPSGRADLTAVEIVSKDIAKFMNGYKIIVDKSTVPVGTQKLVTKIIKENQIERHAFDVVSNPEFLREGTAVYDTMNPDRVIIGSDSQKAADVLVKLHKPFEAPIEIMSPESAEMVKYAANAFLATKISFINEIANICEKVGADVSKVTKGMGLDSRISYKFLRAGIGFGGACFPKDTKAIVKIAEELGCEFKIAKSVIAVNEAQKLRPIAKLNYALKDIREKTIGVLGLSFKPGTDDIREAPALEIINRILKLGGKVKAYDPVAMENTKRVIHDIEYCDNLYDTVKNTDALILATEWEEFINMDLEKVKNLAKRPVFIDGRNVFNYEDMTRLGFEYYCIGRVDIEFKKTLRENIFNSK